MTILTALATLYPRLVEEGRAPRPGYSNEQIGGEIVINTEGEIQSIRTLLIADAKGKLHPQVKGVPAAFKRTSGIKPNRLWDKTSYTLGVTGAKNEGADDLSPVVTESTTAEYAAFKAAHLELLANTEDEGLRALRLFVEHWSPEQIAQHNISPNLLDKNLVFRLKGDTGPDERQRWIHDRPAARQLFAGKGGEDDQSACLVSGTVGPVARLHPSIKGVPGAQSSGASLVSFNDQAYESFGHKQGDNAPVSERAAAAYGTALNTLLARGSDQVTRIGDTTVVFWAHADDGAEARLAETLMAEALMGVGEEEEEEEADEPEDSAADLDEEDEEEEEEDDDEPSKEQDLHHVSRGTIVAVMDDLGRGKDRPELKLSRDTKVYILGLAPNAARLSVRFWVPGRLGDFAKNVSAFWQDLRLEPAAWKSPAAAWSLLYETARITRDASGRLKYTIDKDDKFQKKLGGELMRAVLTDQPLPRTLVVAIIERIRADGQITSRRAAICKAFLARNRRLAKKRRGETIEEEEDTLVQLNEANPDPAYRLGRLFAVLEQIQLKALPGLNATIKDRYFASASATPSRVFPIMVRNAMHHLSNLKKGDEAGLAWWFDKQMGEIWLGLEPKLPRALNLEDQNSFVAGYYHQRWTPRTHKDHDTGPETPEEPTE